MEDAQEAQNSYQDHELIIQSLLPAMIQLANVFTIEVNAKRHPINPENNSDQATSSITLEGIQFDEDKLRIQDRISENQPTLPINAYGIDNIFLLERNPF